MFWRRWFSKTRFEGERDLMQRRGQWGGNFQTVEVLLSHLRTASFNNYSLPVSEQATLMARSPNVDDLTIRTQRAVWLVTHDEYVTPDVIGVGDWAMTTLDHYLVTQKAVPIRPADVVKVLGDAAAELVHELGLLVASESLRSGYYQRQYVDLMNELVEVMQALFLHSDHYVKPLKK